MAKARLRHELTSALRQGEFCLYYQPIYEADGQRMAGVEVLARWLRDGVAVPAGSSCRSRRSGQIISLGGIVLRQLARELPRWLDHRPGLLRVRQSVGAGTGRWPLVEELLDSDLTQRPSQLVIEITESLELQENSRAAANLTRLREAGMRIAIDDFGAGFSISRASSGCTLLLKIDRTWCAAPAARPKGVAFLTAATSVAASLNCDVVAEGWRRWPKPRWSHCWACGTCRGYRYCRARPDRAFLGRQFRLCEPSGLNPRVFTPCG